MDECDMFACLLPGLSRFLSVVWQYKQSPAKWLQPRLRHRVNGRIQIQLSSLISDWVEDAWKEKELAVAFPSAPE